MIAWSDDAIAVEILAVFGEGSREQPFIENAVAVKSTAGGLHGSFITVEEAIKAWGLGRETVTARTARA